MVVTPEQKSKELGKRLRSERQKQGISLREVARRLGADPNIISRLETGKRQMSVEWLLRLCDALGIRAADLIESGRPEEHIEVRATACADRWLEDCWYGPGESHVVQLPADPRYPGVQRIAVELGCNSMDLRYPAGSLLICVPLEAIEGGIEVNKRYLIRSRRERNGQRQDKLSIKTLIMGEDSQLRFVTECSDPASQHAMPAFGLGEDQVQPIALVIGSMQPE